MQSVTFASPHRKPLLALGALCAAVPLLAETSDEAGVLEEVVVTAQKTATNIQETPVSIVAVSGEEIAKQGRNDIRDVLSEVAGVNFSNSAFGASNINMRGIEGVTAPIAGKTDPGVALNFDGVYSSSLLGDAGSSVFYDMARVEVLRGPQGTLYGRNAEGGVINLVSNNPTDSFGLSGLVEAGNYHLLHASGAINLPLGDAWAARVAVNSVKRDGYYTSGMSAADDTSARVKLKYDGQGAFNFLVGTEYTIQGGALGTGGAQAGVLAWGLGDPSVDPWDDVTKDGGLTGQPPGSTRDHKRYKVWTELNLKTGLGTFLLLPSWTKIINNDVLNQHPAANPVGAYTGRAIHTDGYQDTVELRWTSNPGTPLQWIVGGFYAKEYSHYITRQFNREGFQDNKSTAGFGQVSYDFAGSWTATAGIRVSSDKKAFHGTRLAPLPPNPQAPDPRTWNNTDWKVGIQKKLSEDSMVYASIATGYRPGGIDTTTTVLVPDINGNLIENTAMFSKPESVTAFEVGAKNELFGRRLRLNGDVYYYDYKDRQFTYFVTTADPTTPCPNGSRPQNFPPDVVCNVMLNVDKVKSLGAEIDALWLATEHDRINVSLAYNDTQGAKNQQIGLSIPTGFQSVPPDANRVGNLVYVNVDGKTTPRAPKLQANLWYEHGFSLPAGALYLRGDVRYMSKSYMSAFSYLNPVINAAGYREGDSYVIEANTRYDATLRFEPTAGNWSVSLYGKNLTEEKVKSDTDGKYTQVEAPRTVGIIVSAHL